MTEQTHPRTPVPQRRHQPAEPAPAQVGDVWYRVDGEPLGDEAYQGMKLLWSTWTCCKTTPRGAWFQQYEWSRTKPRFALTIGARVLSRTRQEALDELIARKQRQLHILHGQTVTAQDTLDIAREALAEMTKTQDKLKGPHPSRNQLVHCELAPA